MAPASVIPGQLFLMWSIPQASPDMLKKMLWKKVNGVWSDSLLRTVSTNNVHSEFPSIFCSPRFVDSRFFFYPLLSSMILPVKVVCKFVDEIGHFMSVILLPLSEKQLLFLSGAELLLHLATNLHWAMKGIKDKVFHQRKCCCHFPLFSCGRPCLAIHRQER